MTTHLTRVKARMSIHAHRKVRGLLEGEYASMHTGRSLDFNDLREYVRGDDVKDIDWKASARSRALLVKRYAAARKHTILLVASTGRSMAAMNDLDVPKRDLSVMVAGVVGYLAVRHGDRVGLAWGDAAVQHQLPAASGELNLENRLASIHDNTLPTSAPSDLLGLLDHVARTVRRRTILVVISDEYTIDRELSAMLRRLAVQHEVLFVSIGDLDPTSMEVNQRLVDIDSGQVIPEWARRDTRLRQEYASMLAGQADGMRRELDGLGIIHQTVHDDASAIRAVLKLLERHRHAGRR
ncbi:DUF58 domain-containing protein [Nocardioides sp. JQ2195]|uniref:DUF58 domain-containing protein n=1 Tax=Nocardioides sp. JQ2195 TaxID=2592334 RepID=UPI00143EF3CC|nr:DUF58 domain-containing protein [Nocardioides sp. JQ2195]QIX26239.1 DUF58 domain-containing protein [Nocardioides sp. JQ2195]